MQPILGAPAPSVRAIRLGQSLPKLFPLMAVLGVIVEYLYLWDSKDGGGIVVYAVLPLVLLVAGVFTFGRALRHPLRNWAAMAMLLAFALAVTAAMFFASVHGLEVKAQTSELARKSEDASRHVTSLVTDLEKINPQAILVDAAGVLKLEEMGYTECYLPAPALKDKVKCPYQFKYDAKTNQVNWVSEPQFPNPFYSGATMFDGLLWVGVLFGLWGAVYLYVANLPGPLRRRA